MDSIVPSSTSVNTPPPVDPINPQPPIKKPSVRPPFMLIVGFILIVLVALFAIGARLSVVIKNQFLSQKTSTSTPVSSTIAPQPTIAKPRQVTCISDSDCQAGQVCAVPGGPARSPNLPAPAKNCISKTNLPM